MKIKIKVLYSKELDLTLLVDYDNNYLVYRELAGSYKIYYQYQCCDRELKRLCEDTGLKIKYLWQPTPQNYTNYNFYITRGLNHDR